MNKLLKKFDLKFLNERGNKMGRGYDGQLMFMLVRSSFRPRIIYEIGAGLTGYAIVRGFNR